jgi:hypothetical protein
VAIVSTMAAGYWALRLTTARASPHKAPLAFSDARPLVDRFRADGHLPSALADKTDTDLVTVWPAWVTYRDAEIRSRLHRGDEDSVVHLWLFGTSFTARPRATTPVLMALGPDGRTALLRHRLDDLIAAMRAPDGNERLVMARRVLERSGFDVMAPAGHLGAARHLETLRERMMSELQQFRHDTVAARERGNSEAAFDAYLTYYQRRGLSSDTSLLATYSVERALEDARDSRTQARGSIRRVAIVGPGLDFVDKAEGHDFYPPQTLQPFALVDSLIRVGLADPDGVEVTTFDISPRVVDHITEAHASTERGDPYVVHVPLDPDDATHAWHPDVVRYWQRFGDRIGTEVAPRPLPPSMEDVHVRAVRVRPGLVGSVQSRDLNIILERVSITEKEPAFDLIVATNILVYYERFEQALALANVSAMLRPGGLFLSNGLALPLPLSGLSSPSLVDVVFDQQQGGDTLYWFRRLP